MRGRRGLFCSSKYHNVTTTALRAILLNILPSFAEETPLVVLRVPLYFVNNKGIRHLAHSIKCSTKCLKWCFEMCLRTYLDQKCRIVCAALLHEEALLVRLYCMSCVRQREWDICLENIGGGRWHFGFFELTVVSWLSVFWFSGLNAESLFTS